MTSSVASPSLIVLTSCIVCCRSYTFTVLYRMAENIGGELNLANWQSSVGSPNLLHVVINCIVAQP